MDDELDERTIGNCTLVTAMVHMPALLGDPGLITVQYCEITEVKKRLYANLPLRLIFTDPHRYGWKDWRGLAEFMFRVPKN